jgi:hypothetical protein
MWIFVVGLFIVFSVLVLVFKQGPKKNKRSKNEMELNKVLREKQFGVTNTLKTITTGSVNME